MTEAHAHIDIPQGCVQDYGLRAYTRVGLETRTETSEVHLDAFDVRDVCRVLLDFGERQCVTRFMSCAYVRLYDGQVSSTRVTSWLPISTAWKPFEQNIG